MFKKLLTAILTFAMLLGSLPYEAVAYASESPGGGISTLADDTQNEEYVKTKITSLVYIVTATDIQQGTGFMVQNSDWNDKNCEIKNDVTGEQELSISFDNETNGMVNMGYIYDTVTPKQDGTGNEYTMTDSNAEVVIHKVKVNGNYEIPVNVTLSKNASGLHNRWSGLNDGDKVYEGTDSYFAYEGEQNSGNICFYVKSSGGESGGGEDNPQNPQDKRYEKTKINKLVYNVTTNGVQDGTKFKAIDSSWYTQEVVLNAGSNTQDLQISYNGADGMKTIGYICNNTENEQDIMTGDATVTVNSITVNDSYEIPIGVTLSSQSKDLKNIWSGLKEGDKAYEGTDSYFAYDSSNDGQICFYTEARTIKTDTPSMEYVRAMGNGWNLGNSLECINTNLDEEDTIEEAWGNPKVTRELIQSVKQKGFNNIRIPLTFYRRYTINQNAKDNEYKYVINRSYLDRAEEVIGWALDEGFYVMTNIHHDSWTWLEKCWDGKAWDENNTSEEYRMYKDFWGQLADRFKDKGVDENSVNKLCFETINEYNPGEEGTDEQQQQVMFINKTAHDIIRASGGNNTKRMIVMPTYDHNAGADRCLALNSFIKELNDPYIIAAVHYYSEWVYSINKGITGFNEPIGEGGITAKESIDNFMDAMREGFLNDGIGVIVSEFGVLGYDTGDNCMQIGEEIKYYDYIRSAARDNNVCLMFWDNGSGISRVTNEWKYPRVGDALSKTMDSRISYATGLDTIYFAGPAQEDVQIPLTLNGTNTFTGITGLTKGTDYTYADSTVTLKKDYVNSLLSNAGYGKFKDLDFCFDNGYVWHEYLVYYGTPSYEASTGSKDGNGNTIISIPFKFNGSEVRRVTAYQASGRVGPDSSWWLYLQYGKEYTVDYTKGTFSLTGDFFNKYLSEGQKVKDGELRAVIEFYDGQKITVYMEVEGDNVKCKLPSEDVLKCAGTVVLYAGETEIPSQYITASDGYKIYGESIQDSSMAEFKGSMIDGIGWRNTMAFDTKAHENMTEADILLHYIEKEIKFHINLGIKDAPVIAPISLQTGKSGKISISNLAEDAVCTYGLSDASVATIAKDGTITALKAGKATIRATVSQYGRTDVFETSLEVNDAQYIVTFGTFNPDNAKVSVSVDGKDGEFATGGKVFADDKLRFTITPADGYAISSAKANVNGNTCKTPEIVQAANGVYIITLSGFMADTKVDSLEIKTEKAAVRENGTDTINNVGGANLSQTMFKGIEEDIKNDVSSALEELAGSASANTQEKENARNAIDAIRNNKAFIDISIKVDEKAGGITNEDEKRENNAVIEDIRKETQAGNSGANVEVKTAAVLDISLLSVCRYTENNQVIARTPVNELTKPVKIVMELPGNIPAVKNGTVRTYYIICLHKNRNGRIESSKVQCSYDRNRNMLSFDGSRFSTYVLCYTDTTPKQTTTPPSNNAYIPGNTTQTPVPTATPVPSPVPSVTPSVIPSVMPSPSATPGATASNVPSVTVTPVPSVTPSVTDKPSQTVSPSNKPASSPEVKKGTKFITKGITYKVASVSGTKTVTCVSARKNIKEIVIPASVQINSRKYNVTAIAKNAFSGNKKLTKITVGKNITSIGKNAFRNCKNLKKIVIKTKKLTAKKVGSNAFKGINSKAVVKVPEGKVKAYKKIIKAKGAGKKIKVKK